MPISRFIAATNHKSCSSGIFADIITTFSKNNRSGYKYSGTTYSRSWGNGLVIDVLTDGSFHLKFYGRSGMFGIYFMNQKVANLFLHAGLDCILSDILSAINKTFENHEQN